MRCGSGHRDSHDQHRSFRPALAGQPGGDGSAPPRLPGAVRCRIHFEGRRTHSAPHIGRIPSGTDDCARSLRHHRGPALVHPRCSPALWRRPAADPGPSPAGRRPPPKCGAELTKMPCPWEPPFANCLAGAPGGDYLSRACDAVRNRHHADCRRAGERCTYICDRTADDGRMHRAGLAWVKLVTRAGPLYPPAGDLVPSTAVAAARRVGW